MKRSDVEDNIKSRENDLYPGHVKSNYLCFYIYSILEQMNSDTPYFKCLGC